MLIIEIISLAGLLLSAGLVQLRRAQTKKTDEHPSRSIWAWALFFMLIQAFICIWSALGLVNEAAGLPYLDAAVATLLLCACVYNVLFENNPLRKVLAKAKRPLLIAVLIVLIAAFFAVLGIEISSNHDLFNFEWVYPLCLLLEWWLIAMVMVGLFFICNYHGVVPSVAAVAVTILGIAEYFVLTFKNMPIQPGDLSALSTAAAVSAGYTYALTPYCLLSLSFMGVAAMLCQQAGLLMRGARTDESNAEVSAQEAETESAEPAAEPAGAKPEATLSASPSSKKSKKPLAIRLGIGFTCLLAVVLHVTCIDYYNMLGITIRTWYPQESYWRQCYLPTFISATQTINPPKPKGYEVDTATELIDKYAEAYDEANKDNANRAAAEAQFDEEQPTVIAVMNETFSDLSIFENLHADYQGPQYFKSISDCLSRGALYVSAFGGGTCNSEYEFLTGNSMANLGSGVYPYTIYDLVDKENLAAQFSEMGYTTTVMHPNHADNWNRTNVYNDLGFDYYLSIDSYEGAETLRGMVTDKACYDKVLEQLESTNNPQFIFNVTMQNHSGYNTGLIPADKMLNVDIDGVSAPNMNEYLSLIQQSDEALEYFIRALQKVDKKIVLVFFGDHQPSLMTNYNDLWFTGEEDAVHQERLWQTDYIIWANYDVAGNEQTSEQLDLSTNYLGAKLMEVIGAPMTKYQKALIRVHDMIPAINATGFEDSRRRWYLTNTKLSKDADPVAQACWATLDDYAYMQYYQMFGDGSQIFTTHFQTTANMTDPNGDPNDTKPR